MIEIKESMITQTFEVEIITPTHIGGAAENHWQNGMDFVVRDNKTWILDFKKLSEEISIDKLTLAFRNISLDNLINNGTLKKVFSKKFDYNVGSNEIKRQIFSGFDGKPYIPGSSIKGAVSSILLNYFYQQNKSKLRKDQNINKNVLGDFDNSIMRFFQFTDVQFENTFLFNTKIFNLQKNNLRTWEGGWKHGKDNTTQIFNTTAFTTVYESLQLSQKSTMMLSFKKKAIEQLYFDASKVDSKTKTPPTHTSAWLTNNPTAELCKIINRHTIAFLEKEIKFYEEYKFDTQSENVFENIVNLKERVARLDSTKECILRLAAGSGFHSITGDWQYDDFINTGENNNGKRKYKSRKLAFENGVFQPMGFIKLTLLSEEEIEKAKLQVINDEEKRREEVQKSKEQSEQKAIEAAIAEAEQIEKERIVAEEARKPKMFEGILNPSDIIDAEVVSVAGNKVKLKLYAPNQSGNIRDFTYSGLQIGQVLQVIVKAIAKSNGLIVALDFHKIKI